MFSEMFEAVIRGETWKAAADAGGVTTERARQVIHKMRRMMMHPKRLGADAVPDHDYWQVAELRRCADFWMAQLAKWKAEHGSNDELSGTVPLSFNKIADVSRGPLE